MREESVDGRKRHASDVLVTGAGGYVGASLRRELSRSFSVVGTRHSAQPHGRLIRLDVTDGDAVCGLVEEHRPRFIVHAAALIGDGEGPGATIEVNSVGTRNVVRAADMFDATVIYISDAKAALRRNAYESSKFYGEEAVRGGGHGRHDILRLSAVFGLSPNRFADRPFNRMLENLDGIGPFDYDDSVRFQPTWIGHVSEVVAEIVKGGMHGLDVPVMCAEMRTEFDVASDVLGPFGVEVRRSGDGAAAATVGHGIGALLGSGLPRHGYDEIRGLLIGEVKRRNTIEY